MSNIKPSDHGIVVEGKESGLRYASLDENFDPATERKVRDLKPGESVFSYQPKRKPEKDEPDEDAASDTGDNGDHGMPTVTGDPAGDPTALSGAASETPAPTTKTTK